MLLSKAAPAEPRICYPTIHMKTDTPQYRRAEKALLAVKSFVLFIPLFAASCHRLLAWSVLIATLAFQAATAHATDYYFSWATGNDAWPGTIGQPKKTVKEANRLLRLPGTIHRVLFHRGETWYDSSVDHVLNLENRSGTSLDAISTRLEINAYGDPSLADPVISSLNRLTDSLWQRVPNTTTWWKTVSYPDAWRLYVGGVSKLNVRDAIDPDNPPSPLPNENQVDQLHEWFIKPDGQGGGIVYVNTGSTVNGPVGVEVHPKGQTSVLFMRNTNYAVVQNIDFRGGSEYNVVHIEAPGEYLIFDSNEIKQANASGLLVANHLGTDANDWIYNIQITNNVIDKTWTTQENYEDRYLSGDGIFILHAVDTALVTGNVVKNWGHVGITLSAYRPGFRGVRNIRVEDNEIDGANSGYMHGFDVSGGMTVSNGQGWCTNNVVCRNYIRNYTATCHALGNGNKFYSNIFSGYKRTTMTNHTDFQPYALDIETFYSTVYGAWAVGRDNIIANNTFYDLEGYAISLGEMQSHATGGNNPYTTTNNKIYNNIMMRCGTHSTVPDMCMIVKSSVRGTNPIRNNVFWNPAVSNPGTAAMVSYLNVNYNATQLDATFSHCDGNLQDAPVFDAFFGLTPAAPLAIRAGGLDIDSIMGANFIDFDGNQWLDDGGQSPSIGAVQYYPPE